MSTKSRTLYFDYLRTFCAFAVVIGHSIARVVYNLEISGFEWRALNIICSALRWVVPGFIMISGALFLGRDIPAKKVFSKYISRLIVAYFVWSAIYVVFSMDRTTSRLSMFLNGHYHMWFIPLMILLYILLPFFRYIVKNPVFTKVYLGVVFVCGFVFPQTLNLINDFIRPIGIVNNPMVQSFINLFGFFGFGAYFILGYYLNNHEFSRNTRIVIYVLGILGYVATAFLTYRGSLVWGSMNEHYYENMTLNLLFMGIAAFVACKHISFKENKLVSTLSKFSFGVYLVHPLIVDNLDARLHLNVVSFNVFFALALVSLTVFVVSNLITLVLSKIPVLKDYMI